ncbi:MAG: hypothetical protein OXI71_01580 [Gemmatimonadota bacterium]|nr:hypothetical protein [Gemmatimonadota bacterium]
MSELADIVILLVVFAYWKWTEPRGLAALLDYLRFGPAGDKRAMSADSR